MVAVDDAGDPDSSLFAALARQDEARARDALATLYARHAPALRRFLARFQGADEARREDWLHDTFLTAMRHASSFRVGSARPWLFALAARHVRDSRRAERRRGQRDVRAGLERDAARECAPPCSPGPELDLEPHLAALPERQRVVLELRYVEALAHAQVADVLGVSERTAKAWAAEALDALRARLAARAEGGRA